MSICYWQLCHCPDATPCEEHQGFDCSLVDGVPITNESQIKDAITRSLEGALLVFAGDENQITAIKTRLEKHIAELQEEKSDIERDASAAADRHERSTAADRATRANERAKQIADEVDGVMDELAAMNTRWQTAVATGTARLIIPYADVVGYCPCYDRKKQRLAVIAGQNRRRTSGLRRPSCAIQCHSDHGSDLWHEHQELDRRSRRVRYSPGVAVVRVHKTAATVILVSLIVIALALLALLVRYRRSASRDERIAASIDGACSDLLPAAADFDLPERRPRSGRGR
jgi:hypothetical protein